MTWLLVFVLFGALYVGIQRNVATNRKIRVAKAVDDFLGHEDAPDEYKYLVWGAYEDCTNPFLAFEMTRYFLFAHTPEDRAQTLDKLQSMEHRHPEYFDEMGELLKRLMKINLKMAPGSYALSIVILALASLYRFATRSGTGPAAIWSKAQDAYFKSVHP